MKYNKTAFIIMLVSILVVPAISGISSMNKLAKSCNDYFISGGNSNDNFSIYNDLQDKANICNNLVSLANNYISSSDSHLKDIQKLVSTIKSSTDVSDLFKANTQLDNNVDWLIAELEKKDLSSTHANMLQNYKDAYRNEVKEIGFDENNYNLMVKAYYDETRGIPGSLFGIFVKDPEYFR